MGSYWTWMNEQLAKLPADIQWKPKRVVSRKTGKFIDVQWGYAGGKRYSATRESEFGKVKYYAIKIGPHHYSPKSFSRQ